MGSQMPVAVTGAFSIIWVLMMLVGLASYVVALVAMWRAMRAHESIAQTLQGIALGLRSSPGPPPPISGPTKV